MANLERTTATWEIVCFQLYTREEKRALLGYPPLTQRSLDEIFLCRAILGLLCVTDDDYMNLRKRLRSQGFSDNLIALSTLRAPRKQNFAKAHQRAKAASQTYGNYDDEDQDNYNLNKDYQQKIHLGFADLFRFTVQRRRAHQNPTSCPVNPPHTIYYSTGLLPHDLTPYRRDYTFDDISYATDNAPTSDQESKNDRPLEPFQEDIHRAFPAAPLTSPDHPAMPCGGILPLPADDAVLPHTNQGTPATKKLLGVPSWELICLVLYDGYKKRELLGFPPKLTGREIDQIFLYRVCTATLFMMGEDWMDLQQRLRSAGYYSEDMTGIKSLSSDKKQAAKMGALLQHRNDHHHHHHVCSSKLFWLTQASIEARLKRKRASAVAHLAIHENYLYYGSSHDHPTVLHGPKGEDVSLGPIARQRIVPESSTTFSIDQKLLSPMENTLCKEEKLATDAITVANDNTVKVPNWRYPSKRNFRLVVIIAALLGALCLHVLHWNLLGTDHGLRGEPSKPQLRGSSFSKNVQAIWSSKKPFAW